MELINSNVQTPIPKLLHPIQWNAGSYDLFYTPHFRPQVTLALGNSASQLTEKMTGGCVKCDFTFIDLKDEGQ